MSMHLGIKATLRQTPDLSSHVFSLTLLSKLGQGGIES